MDSNTDCVSIRSSAIARRSHRLSGANFSRTVALLLLSSFFSAGAELPRETRREIRRLLKGDLYLRINAPYRTGFNGFAVWTKPVLRISPGEGQSFIDRSESDDLTLELRPNDLAELSDIEFDDGRIEIELEGKDQSAGRDTNLLIVDVRTVEDFKRAFDKVFSRVPLEEEHPEWPDHIRTAIRRRELVPGMSTDQVRCVTGAPSRVERVGEADIELWILGSLSGSFGEDVVLKFVGGSLILGGHDR